MYSSVISPQSIDNAGFLLILKVTGKDAKSPNHMKMLKLGVKSPHVQVMSLGPNNDNPNYIISIGDWFGFLVYFENINL